MADTKYVKGADALKRRIATIRSALQLPPMQQEISTLLLRRTLTRFDNQTDPNGDKWVPLAPSTIMRRARAGTGTKALNATGQMRASIQVIRGTAQGSVYVNTGAGFRIGITDSAQTEKGRAHNLGKGGMPQRRFLGISQLDVRAVAGVLTRRAKRLDLIERTP